MYPDRTATPPRSSMLPWLLLVLLSIGIVGYLFRAQLGSMLRLTSVQSAPGLTTGGVLTSIQDLSTLESVAMNYQVLVRETRDGHALLLGLDKQRALIVADGTVTAGVNLARLTEDDVRVSADGQVVRITLPSLALLSVNVTKFSTEDIETGLFGLLPADETLHDTALISAQTKMRELACDSQIIQLAGTNAERTITQLFALMEGVDVVVESRAAPSCSATMP